MGDYCFLSHPFDLDIVVLGVIRVRLTSLQIEATLTARGEGADARDGFEGYMSTVQGLLGDDEDLTDLGAVGAAIVGGGLHPEEVGEEIPRVCSEMPCALLDAVGGDCQIASSEDPWVLPIWCQDAMDAR